MADGRRRLLASLPVQDAKAYAGPFPKITEPKEVACFSRDADRSVHFDRRQLRAYRPATLPAELDAGFDGFRPKDPTATDPAPLKDVIGALVHHRVVPQRGQIVTYRNNLNKLFLTPYNRKDDWEIGVESDAADGTVRLHVRDTARKTSEEASKSERDRRFEYWGYRFEQLSTLSAAEAKALAAFRARNVTSDGAYRVPSPSDPGSFDELYGDDELPRVVQRYGGAAPASSPLGPVDANMEFCIVCQLSIGKAKLLMAAEIDCMSDGSIAGQKPGSYVELKTSKQHLTARDLESFERHKQLKFWLQSFLAGVPTVIVGFRDDAGRVLELKTYETRSMHKGSIREKGYWDAAACFSFGCSALEWLLEQLAKLDVAAASRCILRYEPSAAALQLLLVEDAIEQGSGEQVSKRPRVDHETDEE